MDDFTSLLERAQAGDRDARNQLFVRYEARILALVRRRMGPNLRRFMDSVDVQQSVMKDALRDLRRVDAREEKDFIAWLARVTEHKLSNKARDQERGKRAAVVVPLEPADSEGPAPAGVDPPAAGPSPLSFVGKSEEAQRARAALERLPPHWRQVVELRLGEDCDWPEIARRTGHTVKAVQGYFVRARMELGKLLGE